MARVAEGLEVVEIEPGAALVDGDDVVDHLGERGDAAPGALLAERRLLQLDGPQVTPRLRLVEADLYEAAFWNKYMKAYSDILTRTSPDRALWYVIPADDKWYMRYVVSLLICMRLKKRKLHYPEITPEKKAGIDRAKELFGSMKKDSD
jgi:hypothetical protein